MASNLHQQRSLERQREHFNSIANRYRDARRAPNHLYLKELLWQDVLGDVHRFRGRTVDVLEPMCGLCDGLRVVERYLAEGVNYSGFDYSDKIVELVRGERPDLNVWKADASTFSPKPESYDVIILIGGLHHIPDHAPSIVTALAKGLRIGGLFINFEPTYGNSVFRWAREHIYRTNMLFDPETERSFAVEQLLDMFRSAELAPIKIRYPGLLSYVLYYNPDAFPALNVGGRAMVRSTFLLDRFFYANPTGRALSFATLSVWERPFGNEKPRTQA